MDSKYNSTRIRKFFDEYGAKEWVRFEETVRGQVAFYIHNHYLQKYIKKGDKVLDIGAGPGRFTIELAKLGAKTCVSDISEAQLNLNEQKVKEAGFESSILWRKQMDISEPLDLLDNEFDAVICYGGPLSYIFEKASEALSELIRITKPNRYILLGVMSQLGSTQLYLDWILKQIKIEGIEIVEDLMQTGDVVGELAEGDHYCHMFKWSELRELIGQFPCTIVDVSASNFLSMDHSVMINKIRKNTDIWNRFLKWELEFCKESGIIDSGTHIIVIVRKD